MKEGREEDERHRKEGRKEGRKDLFEPCPPSLLAPDLSLLWFLEGRKDGKKDGRKEERKEGREEEKDKKE
jgi:hypothetical protein